MSRPPASLGRAVPALLFVVVLGLPDGSIGVVWPSMRSAGALDRSVGDLGVLALAAMAPYLAASVATGRTLARFGVRTVLLVAAIGGACSLALAAVAPVWAVEVLAVAALGGACGGIDGAVNAHLAVHGTQADLAFAHGTYGVGGTAGPLLATLAVVAWPAAGWRVLFGAFAVAAAATVWVIASSAFGRDASEMQPASRPEAEDGGRAPRGPAALTLVAFVFYTAAEGATAAWAYTLLTEGRGDNGTIAGLAVAGFWGGLTGGRFLLATAGKAWAATTVLHVGVGLAATGALVLFADPAGAGAAALPFIGLGLAGIFPLLVSLTPARVGDAAASRVVGWSIAAAAVGGPSGVAAVGALADRWGPDAIAPALVAAAGALVIAHLALDRLAPAATA